MKNKANVIIEAMNLQAQLEDKLQEFFDGSPETWREGLTFNYIGFDPYDASIELYVREDAYCYPDKLEQLMGLLGEWGFTYGWINYDDGSEIHFSGGVCHSRKKVDHPHWTKEIKKVRDSSRSDEFLGMSRPVLRRLINGDENSPIHPGSKQ